MGLNRLSLWEPTPEERAAFERMAVVVVTPCKDSEVPIKFAKCLANMIAYSWLHGLRVYQFGYTERMVVHWGRNELARLVKDKMNEYTAEPYTHILWLDDDQVFEPDLLVRLARFQHLDMISAVYYGRTQGKHLPVVYVKDTSDDPYKHFPLIEVPPTLCEVDAIGFGACLMRRDVLDRMSYPWFDFKDCGEDVYFCVRAKEAGIHIFCEGSLCIGHIGEPPVITRTHHLQYMQDNADLYRDRVKVGLGGNQWQSKSGPPAG